MDWHQINYFQTVAQVQHITQATKQLSISQPALSRSISKLEDELGVQLFDRKGRNIYLNRYGKMFLHRVEQSIRQIEIGKQEVWNEIHPNSGTILLSFFAVAWHEYGSGCDQLVSTHVSSCQFSVDPSIKSADYRAINVKRSGHRIDFAS
ncbi:LysR family transcriptional regulator [Bacillus velezensis]